MYTLSKRPEPEWKTLIPAQDGRPAVRVLFAPVGAKALRLARRAVADVIRSGLADTNEVAGDAFTEAMVRAGMLEWEGIVDDDGNPLQPTPDIETFDDEGNVTGIEYGTVSAFLSEPRLVEASDREYVLPWARRDAEKNGYAPSLNGTSAGAMPEPNTASSAVTPEKTAVAATKRRARPSATTKSTRRKPTRAKKSGI